MKKEISVAGDQGENWANTQFTDSKLFRVDRIPEERVHMGWDLMAKLLDRDTGKELHDIFFIQAKNYKMDILKGNAILDGAVKVWHIKQWEHIQSLTLVVAYNRNESWNPAESGYWIWHDEIIRQIEKNEPNWRERKDDSYIRIRIPESNKLTHSGLEYIYQKVVRFFIQAKQKSINEKSPLKETDTIIDLSEEALEFPEKLINDLVIDIFKQIVFEYQRHEIISKVCKETEYRQSEHQHLDFSMFPKMLSIPYDEVLKPSSQWLVHTFGSSIAWGEVNALFELITTSGSIEKKYVDFTREAIISLVKSLTFNPTYMLISNDLFVEWMELFPDRVFFEEKCTIMKFDDNAIHAVFVINESANRKVLFLTQDSIETIVKYARDTTSIKNFENDIPIGPRGGKLDIRIRSNDNKVEFVFRTVRSFSLVNPENILLLDFQEIK